MLIVGAGPAGATAARTLGLAGVPVRLLDRSAFPRNKPCGGGISVRASERFPYLDGRLRAHRDAYVSQLYLEGPERRIDAHRVRRSGGADDPPRRVRRVARLDWRSKPAPSSCPAWTSCRRRQARRSRRADVARRPDVRALVRHRRRRRAQRRRTTARAESGMAGARGRARHDGGNAARRGCATWIRRRCGSRTDSIPGREVGSREHPPVRRTGRARTKGMRTSFQSAITSTSASDMCCRTTGVRSIARPTSCSGDSSISLRARGIVEGESVTRQLHAVHHSRRRSAATARRGRVLLAGDAGGFVNAFTAEGIYYAMVSRAIWRRARLSTRDGDAASAGRRYFGACDYEIGAELRDSVLITALFVRGSPQNCPRHRRRAP